MIPEAHPSHNPKRHLSRFSHYALQPNNYSIVFCRVLKGDDKEADQQNAAEATSVDIGNTKFVTIVDYFMI